MMSNELKILRAIWSHEMDFKNISSTCAVFVKSDDMFGLAVAGFIRLKFWLLLFIVAKFVLRKHELWPEYYCFY